MRVQELTKKIHDDYPKTWKKIIRYFEKYEEYGIVFGNKSQFCIFMHNDLSELCLIPFSILYGLLEDFFEENGLIITPAYRDVLNKNIGKWQYKLIYKIDNTCNEISEGYQTKQEAKEQALVKACEILERKLNKEK